MVCREPISTLALASASPKGPSRVRLLLAPRSSARFPTVCRDTGRGPWTGDCRPGCLGTHRFVQSPAAVSAASSLPGFAATAGRSPSEMFTRVPTFRVGTPLLRATGRAAMAPAEQSTGDTGSHCVFPVDPRHASGPQWSNNAITRQRPNPVAQRSSPIAKDVPGSLGRCSRRRLRNPGGRPIDIGRAEAEHPVLHFGRPVLAACRCNGGSGCQDAGI